MKFLKLQLCASPNVRMLWIALIIINSSPQDLNVMTLPLALFLIADGRK